MPGFITVDHRHAMQGRWLAPEGFYECLIMGVKFDRTSKGTDFIKITLNVRADVQQEGAGEIIDWPLWKRREPTPKDPEGFHYNIIQQISRVTGLHNGQNFDTVEDWMRALGNKPIRVEIQHEKYNEETHAKVAYIYESQAPVPSLKVQGFVEVKDEELPF